jgi:hypothetical protein
MKINFKALAATLGAVMLTTVAVPNASAVCGSAGRPSVTHSSWHSQYGEARLLAVSEHEAAITGFWHFKFASKGTAGIPDGTPLDAGYSQWHADGTEIMNSGHVEPLESDFCLGVWKQVGACTYKLNHFAISWDSSGTHLVGPARIQEEVTLTDKDHYSGTVTIDNYDESGGLLSHLQGLVTGVRIDVDTPASSIF